MPTKRKTPHANPPPPDDPLARALEALRRAVNAALDWADAMAETLTEGLARH